MVRIVSEIDCPYPYRSLSTTPAFLQFMLGTGSGFSVEGPCLARLHACTPASFQEPRSSGHESPVPPHQSPGSILGVSLTVCVRRLPGWICC